MPENFKEKTMQERFELLTMIVCELNAREFSNNSIFRCYSNVHWEDLCEKAIAILESMKTK